MMFPTHPLPPEKENKINPAFSQQLKAEFNEIVFGGSRNLPGPDKREASPT